MENNTNDTKVAFELEMRNILLQRARRLVKLLKSDAPSTLIVHEIKLLQTDLPAFDKDYKSCMLQSVDAEVGKIKQKYGFCSSKDCYNPVRGEGLCEDCNHEFSEFDAVFEKFVTQLQKVKGDCYESVKQVPETV